MIEVIITQDQIGHHIRLHYPQVNEKGQHNGNLCTFTLPLPQCTWSLVGQQAKYIHDLIRQRSSTQFSSDWLTVTYRTGIYTLECQENMLVHTYSCMAKLRPLLCADTVLVGVNTSISVYTDRKYLPIYTCTSKLYQYMYTQQVQSENTAVSTSY